MSNRSRQKPMIVAGVMSGTSADGINVALVRMRDSGAIELLGHTDRAYPRPVRTAVLAAMNARAASVADLSRLNSILGELYADAVRAAEHRFRVQADLVGCHGQTIYHQGESAPYLGRTVATTWQAGEAAIIAARLGVPVVSDFRPADMAAGGKGAPLVPFLDYLWFRDAKVGRIVQNIGGIANLTAIPGGAGPRQVLAFDTGPGNMVMDAVMQELFGQSFDRDGKIAGSGAAREAVLQKLLKAPFYRARPPKTAGREEFGREFVRDFLRACGRSKKEDVIATATALTARSIADAIRRFVIPRASSPYREIVVSGGGAHNSTLVGMLAEQLAPVGMVVRFSDEFGLPSQAKEAVAFAVLAYQTWNRRPSNVPSATGAKRAVILGKICYA